MSAERRPLGPALLAGAPRPLLSHRAEAALGMRHRAVLEGLDQLLRDGELGTLTIGELATRLGCSRRTLYEIAPTKDQLLLLTLDRLMHRMGRAALDALDADAPPPVQLRQYAVGGIRYTLRSSVYDELVDVPGVRRALDRHSRFAAKVLERIVAAGIAGGEFRPVDAALAANVILASALHLALPDVADDLGRALEESVPAMLDLVLAGLLARRPG